MVGAGAVGSAFIQELSKLLTAIGPHTTIHVFDDGLVESRNLGTQEFFPSDIGKPKVEVLAERCSHSNLQIIPHQIRITEENAFEELLVNTEVINDERHILLDGVDNVESRLLLWDLGFDNRKKILHLAIGFAGVGYINWSNGIQNDTFQMSRLHVGNETLAEYIEAGEDELPPCQLIAHRKLIADIGYMGSQAYAAYIAGDLTGNFERIFGLKLSDRNYNFVSLNRDLDGFSLFGKPFIYEKV